MKLTPLLNNFTSGEWSPLLKGRSDLQQYPHSLLKAENIIILPYGGIVRVPGTHFVAEVKDSLKKVRLVSFEFNVTQAYVLEFGDRYIRFYMNDGQITSGGSPYEISTPYTESQLAELQFTQEADVMYITHPSHWPRQLSRTGHTAWTLTSVTVEKGPLLDANTDSTSTITPSADTGTGIITLTASKNIFQSTHVAGSVWRIKRGYVKIVGYTDSQHVTATIQYGGNLGTGPGATDDWAEGAWSSYRGCPATVTLYEQRLWFAYTRNNPQTFWSSASGVYTDFEIGTADDDAMIYTLASDEVNVIRWIFGGQVLFIGTSGGIWNVSSGETSSPITPTNILVGKQVNFGCNTVPPQIMGNLLYYTQRPGFKVREYSYDYKMDGYIASEVTLLAEHILKSGLVDMAYQQSPYNLLYCVRDDGEVAIFTRNIYQQVMGWSRRVDSGEVESIAVIPRASGGDDEVWFLVKRTVGGTTKRYVEYMSEFAFTNQEDAFFVNSGLSYSGAATETVSGLDHLEGETVSILGDGAVFPDQVVSSGQITISQACSTIHIGLSYLSNIKLPKFEAGSELGTAQGKIQRINRIMIRFYRTLGCKVGVEGKQDTIFFRSSAMDMDEPPDLFTGVKEINFPSGYSKELEVLITQEQPLPLTILSIVPFGETNEY